MRDSASKKSEKAAFDSMLKTSAKYFIMYLDASRDLKFIEPVTESQIKDDDKVFAGGSDVKIIDI
jgi:hypothetical protein